jgi:hypothetical protein
MTEIQTAEKICDLFDKGGGGTASWRLGGVLEVWIDGQLNPILIDGAGRVYFPPTLPAEMKRLIRANIEEIWA